MNFKHVKAKLKAALEGHDSARERIAFLENLEVHLDDAIAHHDAMGWPEKMRAEITRLAARWLSARPIPHPGGYADYVFTAPSIETPEQRAALERLLASVQLSKCVTDFYEDERSARFRMGLEGAQVEIESTYKDYGSSTGMRYDLSLRHGPPNSAPHDDLQSMAHSTHSGEIRLEDIEPASLTALRDRLDPALSVQHAWFLVFLPVIAAWDDLPGVGYLEGPTEALNAWLQGGA